MPAAKDTTRAARMVGQVMVQRGKLRARNMAGVIGLPAGLRIGQIVPARDNRVVYRGKLDL